MAKRKDSKALFEVIKPGTGERSGKPLGVPGWFGQAKPQAPGQARTAGPSTAVPPTATPPPVPRPITATSSPMSSQAAEPLLQVADGRLRVSLNNISAAVVVLGLACVIAGAFYLGKRSGAAGSQGQSGSQNGQVRPGDNAGQPAPGNGNGGAPENVAGPQRVKGYNYLIVASRIGNQAEASAIRDFLHGKGVETTVEQMQDGTFCVKDLTGFRGQRDPKIEERKDAFAKLGAAYHAAGGSYNLSQPYLSLEK